jgi:hypothetical protein
MAAQIDDGTSGSVGKVTYKTFKLPDNIDNFEDPVSCKENITAPESRTVPPLSDAQPSETLQSWPRRRGSRNVAAWYAHDQHMRIVIHTSVSFQFSYVYLAAFLILSSTKNTPASGPHVKTFLRCETLARPSTLFRCTPIRMQGTDMPSPIGKTIAPSPQPALDLISLAQLSPEQASLNLRALLLANPDYFGNLSASSFKAILNIKGDTAYESITSLSYCSQLQQLRAIVKIKRDHGYSLDISTDGSQEFVRFYLSYDEGATWRDQGLGAVNVFDGPGPKPAVHLVTLQVQPEENLGLIKNLPLLRAILSWNSKPPAGTPNWTPLWGNVLEARIQIEELNPDLSSALAPAPQMPDDLAQSANFGHRDVAVPPDQAYTTTSKKLPLNATFSLLPYLASSRRRPLSVAGSLFTSR